MKRHKLILWAFVALSTATMVGCGSSDDSSSSTDATDTVTGTVPDTAPNTNNGTETDTNTDTNTNTETDTDTDNTAELGTLSYLNETWFSLSAQACADADEALILNNGSQLFDQTSEQLNCSVSVNNNALLYSITWTGDDFDRDGVNDTFSFDVRVAGFSGSTYLYSETAGESSVTALGDPETVNVWINNDDITTSVWDIANDEASGQSAGQSLRFTIENTQISASGYNAEFNGFNYINLMETDDGHTHTHIRGEGTGLDSASFSTPTANYDLKAIDELVITGAGDAFETRVWGISDLQFSFSITNPDLATIWEATDLSVHGTGPTYSLIYPQEDPARQALFPEFSWDTVPRWLAVRNADAYTDEQIETIANNYQLVMLEKANKAGFDTVDEGIKDTASRLKAINPNIKTIFYWNTRIHYTGYSSDDEYENKVNEWSTLNDDGSVYLFKDIYYWYDYNAEGFKNWWVDFAVNVALDENIDGVFLDKVSEGAVDQLFINEEASSDYIDTMNTLWNRLPEDKLLMANTLRGEHNNAGRAMMEILDGSYLERWDYTLDYNLPSQKTADAISLSMQLMREALAQGKFINFQTGPWTEEEAPSDYADKLVYMEEHVDFPLAIFLIIAEENAFFSYQEGVNAISYADVVWDSSYIEALSRPLGEPLGDPIKEGYIYTRSYEHVDVWVDVESGKAELTWRDEEKLTEFSRIFQPQSVAF